MRTVLLVGLLCGCEPGLITNPPRKSPGGTSPKTGPEAPPPVVDWPAFDPGTAPLRRLTHQEYDAAVAALVGPVTASSADFPLETRQNGFTGQAASQFPSPLLVDRYSAAAEAIALEVTSSAARLTALLPCTPTRADDPVCLEAFVGKLGRLAYRRPLEATELAALVTPARAQATQAQSFKEAVRFVLEVVLQSPSFLYRVERGETDPAHPGLLRLDGYSIVTRLSFFLWGAPPDDVLLQRAAAGLQSREDVEALAGMMLADARAIAAVRTFYEQWLGIETVEQIEKNPTVFPKFSAALRTSMRREATLAVDHLIWGDGDFTALHSASRTYVDPLLAELYGVTAPASGFSSVELPSNRRGFIGKAAFLANDGRPSGTAPTHRGRSIMQQFLCGSVPPPPPDVESSLPAPVPGVPQTARQRLESHSTQASCSGCHRMMDPAGLALEHFDGIGAWRDTDQGLPIDAKGEVDGKTFDGAAELSQVLATSERARSCVVSQLLRFGLGRSEEPADERTRLELVATFTRSENRFRSLLLAFAVSDAMRFARP